MAFLRSQHAGFQEMAKSLEDGLRSDHLALIRLAFHAVQPTKNPACGVANPKALALALSRTPATARELDGAKIADSLFERMTTVSVRSSTTGAGSDAKIPVAWEEVLAIFATEQSDTAEWMSRLRSDHLRVLVLHHDRRDVRAEVPPLAAAARRAREGVRGGLAGFGRGPRAMALRGQTATIGVERPGAATDEARARVPSAAGLAQSPCRPRQGF